MRNRRDDCNLFYLAMFPFCVANLLIRCRPDPVGDYHEEIHIPPMSSSYFSMTSVQRYDLKAVSERRDKKDLVADIGSLVGTPTTCSHCHHPEIRPWGKAARL